MMEDIEDVAHQAAEWTARLMNMANQTDLALIDPDAVAFRASVDLHILEITLNEITAALRTLHEVLATLDLTTLLVEESAHLPNELSVLSSEVLLLVSCGVVLGVTMHLVPPALPFLSSGAAASSRSSPRAR